jgi:hypothetical protein
VVAVGRAEAQGRAVLEAAKVGPQVLALAARLELEERSVVAVAQAVVAADPGGVYRVIRFLPRSNLQFFRWRVAISRYFIRVLFEPPSALRKLSLLSEF